MDWFYNWVIVVCVVGSIAVIALTVYSIRRSRQQLNAAAYRRNPMADLPPPLKPTQAPVKPPISPVVQGIINLLHNHDEWKATCHALGFGPKKVHILYHWPTGIAIWVANEDYGLQLGEYDETIDEHKRFQSFEASKWTPTAEERAELWRVVCVEHLGPMQIRLNETHLAMEQANRERIAERIPKR